MLTLCSSGIDITLVRYCCRLRPGTVTQHQSSIDLNAGLSCFSLLDKDKEKEKFSQSTSTQAKRPIPPSKVQPIPAKPVAGFFSQYVPRTGTQYYRDLAGNIKQVGGGNGSRCSS